MSRIETQAFSLSHLTVNSRSFISSLRSPNRVLSSAEIVLLIVLIPKAGMQIEKGLREDAALSFPYATLTHSYVFEATHGVYMIC